MGETQRVSRIDAAINIAESKRARPVVEVKHTDVVRLADELHRLWSDQSGAGMHGWRMFAADVRLNSAALRTAGRMAALVAAGHDEQGVLEVATRAVAVAPREREGWTRDVLEELSVM